MLRHFSKAMFLTLFSLIPLHMTSKLNLQHLIGILLPFLFLFLSSAVLYGAFKSLWASRNSLWSVPVSIFFLFLVVCFLMTVYSDEIVPIPLVPPPLPLPAPGPPQPAGAPPPRGNSIMGRALKYFLDLVLSRLSIRVVGILIRVELPPVPGAAAYPSELVVDIPRVEMVPPSKDEISELGLNQASLATFTSGLPPLDANPAPAAPLFLNKSVRVPDLSLRIVARPAQSLPAVVPPSAVLSEAPPSSPPATPPSPPSRPSSVATPTDSPSSSPPPLPTALSPFASGESLVVRGSLLAVQLYINTATGHQLAAAQVDSLEASVAPAAVRALAALLDTITPPTAPSPPAAPDGVPVPTTPPNGVTLGGAAVDSTALPVSATMTQPAPAVLPPVSPRAPKDLSSPHNLPPSALPLPLPSPPPAPSPAAVIAARLEGGIAAAVHAPVESGKISPLAPAIVTMPAAGTTACEAISAAASAQLTAQEPASGARARQPASLAVASPYLAGNPPKASPVCSMS